MKKWIIPFGFLVVLFLLSSCATQQDLMNVQRQLQTTRGELDAVRKGIVEARSFAEEQLRISNREQREGFSRLAEQMNTILSTIEFQQKAIASANSFVQERLSSVEKGNEERLRKMEERFRGGEKEYLASRGNLGTRMGELAAEVKIVQGKLEENNNLLAEQGMRLDELNQQGSRFGGKVEASEANLRAIKEAHSSYAARLGRIEEQVKTLVKSWEVWREQADRSLGQAAGLEKRLALVEAEVRGIKEAYSRPVTSTSVVSGKEVKAERSAEAILPQAEKGTVGSEEAFAVSSSLGGEEIYKSAYADYTQGAYDLAVSGFRSYLTKFPKGTLAPNAQYWLGECYYSQKKFEQSIAEFEIVLRNYPTSQKAPSALLKKGYSHLELGHVAKGKSILMEVLEKYPRTREASLAQLRLANLR